LRQPPPRHPRPHLPGLCLYLQKAKAHDKHNSKHITDCISPRCLSNERRKQSQNSNNNSICISIAKIFVCVLGNICANTSPATWHPQKSSKLVGFYWVVYFWEHFFEKTEAQLKSDSCKFIYCNEECFWFEN